MWLVVGLLAAFALVVTAERHDSRQNDGLGDYASTKIDLDFYGDKSGWFYATEGGEVAIVDSTNEGNGDSVEDLVRVPPHFRKFSAEQIAEEIRLLKMSSPNRWSEKTVLEVFYYAVSGSSGGSLRPTNWLDDQVDVCEWEGITCGDTSMIRGREGNSRSSFRSYDAEAIRSTDDEIIDLDLFDPKSDENNPKVHSDLPKTVPKGAVTKIDLPEFNLSGTLPPVLSHLKYLHRLNLNANSIRGTIPTTFGSFEMLQFIDLGANQFAGTIPPQLADLRKTLVELWLEKNLLTGTFPKSLAVLPIKFFDLSHNGLTGTLPTTVGTFSQLTNFYIEANHFTGTIPTEMGNIFALKSLDMSSNKLSGTIPTEIGSCSNAVEINFSHNRLVGTVPVELCSLANLKSIFLGWNRISGTIPDTMSDRHDQESYWKNMLELEQVGLEHNNIVGTIPHSLFARTSKTLKMIDFSFNQMTGMISSEICRAGELEKLFASSNKFTETIPSCLGDLPDLVNLNLTGNYLTGRIPQNLCDTGIKGSHGSIQACDFVLCAAGTFHPEGAASDLGACRACHDSIDDSKMTRKVLGRTICQTTMFLPGDMDGDGHLTERELLRFIYTRTNGENWGSSFANWGDMSTNKCSLTGVNCKDGQVTKIDLREANLCSNGEGGRGLPSLCPGLPSEIGLFDSLEVLDLSRSIFLRGTIPTEIGQLRRLKVMDLSHTAAMAGTIPTEIGLCKFLRVLNLAESSFQGSLPTSIGRLRMLEKLNLSLLPISGKIPTEIGGLESVKEILLSRSHLTGYLPTELGELSKLENLELYGNSLEGPIPTELSNCASLKRIDFFNNKLTGTIPNDLAHAGMLQIVHLKTNRLTGTLPSNLGFLPLLSWFDASSNYLIGTIPMSFGMSRSLRDLRLGGNRIQGPIHKSLCSNKRLNGGGRVGMRDCDAILCPLGTFSDVGFATAEFRCKACPPGETTLFLGNSRCRSFSQRDFLNIFFEAIRDNEKQMKEWKDDSTAECRWNGIECNKHGEVIGMDFPLFGTSWIDI